MKNLLTPEALWLIEIFSAVIVFVFFLIVIVYFVRVFLDRKRVQHALKKGRPDYFCPSCYRNITDSGFFYVGLNIVQIGDFLSLEVLKCMGFVYIGKRMVIRGQNDERCIVRVVKIKPPTQRTAENLGTLSVQVVNLRK